MITKPTVLILGAGASWDYGFPTGQLLKAKIWHILTDNTIKKALDQYGYVIKVDIEKLKKALELTPDLSIDAFLEHNYDEFGEVGKLAIARVLLPYEKETNLFQGWMYKELSEKNPYSCDIPERGQHWYRHLFNVMSDGVAFDDFKNNKLTIVTFNYDRSVEWFMLQALSAKYQKTLKEAADILKAIPIIHMYGKLGPLQHFDLDLNQATAVYINYGIWDQCGQGGWDKLIMTAAQHIKILHEKSPDILINFKRAQDIIIQAEKIIFLGFGYHEVNMERLFCKIDSNLKLTTNNLLKANSSMGLKCVGTAHKISPHLRLKMAEYGLHKMSTDFKIIMRKENGYMSFDNKTIYDFFQYNPYSNLI